MNAPHIRPPAQASRRGRLLGLDFARGVAVLAMIQTHAYDAWVRPDARESLSYGVTRIIGTLPLPLFLLLAGVSLWMRVRVLEERGRPASEVRHDAARAGLRVVLVGYALNVAYGLMDGGRGLQAFLRADVLHAIGFSLACIALACVGRRVPLRSGATLLGAFALFACPWLTRLAHTVQGPLRYVLAPWVDIPGLTLMPVVPLLVWCALGVLLAPLLVEAIESRALRARLALGSVLAIAVGYLGMRAWMAQGVVPARTHPIIFVNGLDLAGRAVLVTLPCLTVRETPRLAWLREQVCMLGRHSLFGYALHLPFCYGAIAHGLKRSLTMPQASLALALLVVGVIVSTHALESATSLRRARTARAS